MESAVAPLPLAASASVGGFDSPHGQTSRDVLTGGPGRSLVSRTMAHLRFAMGSRSRDAAVSEVPHLDDETLRSLRASLTGAATHLEYGAGGSTLLALKLVAERVVSVDNDKAYLEAIARTAPVHRRAKLDPIYVDTGITGLWGRPLVTLGKDLKQYPRAPWLQRPGFLPDVVLVDGRFRVACVLETLRRTPVDWNGVIYLDDFEDRPYLAAVLPFAGSSEAIGRSVRLRKAKVDEQALLAALDKAYRDHR